MPITPRMEEMLNQQIQMEFFSMSLYLSMASYFNDQELNGFENFFRVQADEERIHAMRQFDYLHNVGGRLRLGANPAVDHDFTSVLQVIKQTLAHEQKVSAAINKLVELSLEEKDYATHAFLQWFVTEQVEEEALMQNVLRKVERIGDNTSALYLLDEEMARRKLAPAPKA